MRILVTGSTGFIGSNICKALVEQGHQVRAFHRPESPQELLEGVSVEHAVGNITEPATLQGALEGIQAIFHTAAQVGRRNSNLGCQRPPAKAGGL